MSGHNAYFSCGFSFRIYAAILLARQAGQHFLWSESQSIRGRPICNWVDWTCMKQSVWLKNTTHHPVYGSNPQFKDCEYNTLTTKPHVFIHTHTEKNDTISQYKAIDLQHNFTLYLVAMKTDAIIMLTSVCLSLNCSIVISIKSIEVRVVNVKQI